MLSAQMLSHVAFGTRIRREVNDRIDAAAKLLHLFQARKLADDDLAKRAEFLHLVPILLLIAWPDHQPQVVVLVRMLGEVRPDVSSRAGDEHFAALMRRRARHRAGGLGGE
jgi:hypothetical protein